MNVYVYIGLLILAYAICAFIVFFLGFVLRSRWLKITGGIALAPVLAAILLLVVGIKMGERRSKDPSWVFEQEFRISPPREVTALRGYATSMNNSGFDYLSFNAPPGVIDSLLFNWMVPASPSDLPRSDPPSSRDRPPFWWHPPAVPPAKFYRALYLRKICDGCGFNEVLYYDPETHLAYFARF
jgi:hypothetical protein